MAGLMDHLRKQWRTGGLAPIEDWSLIAPFHRGPLLLRGWHVANARGSRLTPVAAETLGRDSLLGPGFYFGPESAVLAYGSAEPVEVLLNDPKIMWSPEEWGWDIQTLDDLDEAFGYVPSGGDGIVIPVADVFGADEAQAVLRPGHDDQIRWMER